MFGHKGVLSEFELFDLSAIKVRRIFAHEEVGCGTEHGGIGESEPGSHNRVVFEGRETARAAVLPRGLQH